jgi:PAS domain S-box-containing protein
MGTPLLVAVFGAGGALAMAGAILAFPPSFHGSVLRTSIVLAALTAVSELVAIHIKHGESSEQLTLFELAVVADIVLLPPSEAVIVSVVGLAVSLLIQQRAWLKTAFNLGQYALGVVTAVALYETIGGGDFETTRGLIGLTVGATAFTLINLISISTIISATGELPLRRVLREQGGLSLVMGLGNSAVGMVAVALYLSRPALVPAVLAPAVALHLAFRGWVRQQELTEEMVAESTKLGRIVEHSSEGIVLADATGVVLLWSPSMERSTGVTSEEALGKALPYLLRGRDHFGQPITIDVSDKPVPTEIEIIATDGTGRWLRVQHGPGFDENGALSFDALVVTDVTRQREVDKLKDDFFSTVSHELRTPLTPIKGYATLLLRRSDEMDPARRREALQSILERSDHMARLVEDLLLASRIANTNERRLPEVERKTINVTSVVERTLRSFRTGHPMREFRLETPDECFAMADPIRVEQVVANLVSNAVKFSDEGAPVFVEIEREATEIRVHVTDEGRGIPADKHDEIFEKFKRLEDPLRMETGGAGLGLFIVKQLVRAMGGSVTITSVQGRGSTFTVALPAAASASASGAPFAQQDLAG